MEDLWSQAGAFGPFQWLVLLSLPLAVLAAGGNFLLGSFLIMEPEWACSDGVANASGLVFGRNCSLYHSCSELRFRREFYSITEEWGLLCERSYIAHSIVSLQNIPAWAGLIVWGPVSDAWGRKPAALASTLVTVLASLGAVTAPSWQIFTAFRMLFGFMFAGASTVFVVWGMELTDAAHSLAVNALTHWHYTYVIVALISWLTRDWQGYLLALNLLVSPILLLFAFFFTESPRWLIRKGRLEEARLGLRYIWAWNRLGGHGAKEFNLTHDQLKAANASDGDAKTSAGSSRNFLALFAGQERAIHSAALGLTVLAASVASGTVILDVGQLSGGAFQNLFLIGAFRCATPLLSIALDGLPSVGRRPFFFAANGLVLACFCAVLLSGPRLTAAFSLAGAISNMFVWIVIIQITFELYPTLMRNTAIAYTGLADSTGAVLVPQILFLRRFWPPGPIVVAIALICASVTIGYHVYPETKASAKSAEAGAHSVDRRPLLEGSDDDAVI